MTDEERESFGKLFSVIYKDNKDATDLSFKLLDIAHTWDDLIDKDKPIEDIAINRAFVASIFELQQNSLWFSCGINHHVLSCYLQWQVANSFEKEGEHLEKAYMLRASLYNIFIILAYFIHGDEWARQIGPSVWKYYGETVGDFYA